MKKNLFFLVIMLIVACQAYENYTDVYGEPPKLSDNFARWIDNTEEFLWDMSPIAVMIDTNSWLYQESDYYKNSYQQQKAYELQQFNQAMWECWKPKTLDSVCNRLVNEPDYRNWFLFSTMDGCTYMIETFVAFGYVSSYIPKTYSIPTKNVVLNSVAQTSRNSSEILAAVRLRNGTYLKYEFGNKDFGYSHSYKRHAPEYYAEKGIVPSEYCNLFLTGEETYIVNLFKQLENANCYPILARGSYKGIRTKLYSGTGVMRWYEIIYEPSTGRVITFYPSSIIQPQYLGTSFELYRHYKHSKNKNYANSNP